MTPLEYFRKAASPHTSLKIIRSEQGNPTAQIAVEDIFSFFDFLEKTVLLLSQFKIARCMVMKRVLEGRFKAG